MSEEENVIISPICSEVFLYFIQPENNRVQQLKHTYLWEHYFKGKVSS